MTSFSLSTAWDFSSVELDGDDDLVAVGGDLEPGTLVSAYANGLFPMGVGDGGRPPMGWWSPLERGVLRRGEFHVSRSLRRSARHFHVTVDAAFADVVVGCADPRRDGAWITDDVSRAYGRLHDLGIAHSVEVWQGGELVGGLYGLAIGGLFAGESMFHRATDASKVALWHLEQLVYANAEAPRLIDVQWRTPHLASLGAVAVPREEYLATVPELLRAPGITGLGVR